MWNKRVEIEISQFFIILFLLFCVQKKKNNSKRWNGIDKEELPDVIVVKNFDT